MKSQRKKGTYALANWSYVRAGYISLNCDHSKIFSNMFNEAEKALRLLKTKANTKMMKASKR